MIPTKAQEVLHVEKHKKHWMLALICLSAVQMGTSTKSGGRSSPLRVPGGAVPPLCVSRGLAVFVIQYLDKVVDSSHNKGVLQGAVVAIRIHHYAVVAELDL